jgi:hypothetical protein
LLNLSSTSQSATADARMTGLTRLVRRICLLREQGDAAQAGRLHEQEFATALRDLRLAQGPDVLPEKELRALFEQEEQRVAEAVILSELLIPRLVEGWPAVSGPRSAGPARAPAPRPVAPAAGPPAIPDLLDAMLAAERNGRRPAPANQRES